MNKEFLEFADKLVDKSACENISKKIIDTKDLKK